ncbi:unnamed protein product [Aspergillus oryzae]|nr:unnamed protein product [Aspergillus oryzae]
MDESCINLSVIESKDMESQEGINANKGLARQRQPNLPQELLKSLAARLAASKEANCREHILVILKSQETFPIEAIDVLESMPIDDRFAFSPWAKHMHWNEDILMSKFTSSKEKDRFAITITEYLSRARSAVPHIILMHCVSLIHADGEIAPDADNALSTNPYLAEDILHDLIRSINDPHRRNKELVVLVAAGQNALSESSIEVLFQHIDPFGKLSSKEWTDWLKVRQEMSFEERIPCYVKDGHLHVKTSEGSLNVDIRHPDQQRKLREAIQTLNEETDEVLGDDFDILGFPG